MVHAAPARDAWGDSGSAPFSGPVEADETYIGGKRKNMPKSKRKALSGRGAVGKEAVVGVKDRATNRVSAHHVSRTDSLTLANVVVANAEFGAKLFTDDASAYDMLDPYYDHEAVNHSAGEYVRGMAHTNGIESFWSMLKRGYQGTYHKMSPKHLGACAVERFWAPSYTIGSGNERSDTTAYSSQFSYGAGS